MRPFFAFRSSLRLSVPCALTLALASACSSGNFPVGREGSNQSGISVGGACKSATTSNAASCVTGTYCLFANDTCGASGAAGVCTAIPQGATTEYAPVCGCDGKTYGNPGEAAEAGVSVAASGACPTSGGGACTLDVTTATPASCGTGLYCLFANDTCGAGNVTGVCTPIPQIDTTEYAPVCGCDGTTYGNPGAAAGAGVSVASSGACADAGATSCTLDATTSTPASCGSGRYCFFPNDTCGAGNVTGVCTLIPQGATTEYAPVCGCDGKTYPNPGTAAEAGVSVASSGNCADAGTP